VFLIFLTFLATGNPSIVSSDDLEMLYRDYWGDWIYHDQTWYLVAPELSEGHISVWRWSPGATLVLWVESGPREGITAQSAVTIDRENRKLLLRCMVTTRIFALDLDADKPEFVRMQTAADLTGSMVVWDRRLVGAAEPFALKSYSGEAFGLLETINRRLPDDTYHPSQNAVSTHRMIFAKNGHRLALGFSLYPKIVLFETLPEIDRTTYAIRFPGYLEAPERYIDTYSDRANRDYFSGFHHLARLTWFRDRLFGHMKLGTGNSGLWISLGEHDIFVWDNTKKKHQILAMSGDQIVMGRKEEGRDGRITWNLWIETDLPRP